MRFSRGLLIVITSNVQSVHYIWKIRSLRCDPYTINERIGTSEGLGGGILEGFGVSGVDLQEPGNDFCGFELQKPSEL